MEWKALSLDEFDDGEVSSYTMVELYGNIPCGECGGALTMDEPNDKNETRKANLYLQGLSEEKFCKAHAYLQSREVDEHYDKVIKNDFMTLSRALGKYVFEICGFWILAFMNKVYMVMNSQWMAMLLDYNVVVNSACSWQPSTRDCDALRGYGVVLDGRRSTL